ncbi:PTS galactitol transporter subunit IIC [Natronospora cellulosivora (SeqCode)]
MNTLANIVEYIFSFEPYVVLPLLIFLMAILFKIPVSRAFKSALTIGVGFIGIFIILGYFVENIGPAVEALINRTSLEYSVLEVGWPPLAAIAWSFNLAPVFIIVIILINVIMLAMKMTKTVNVDIWNYWHFILVGKMVYYSTNNLFYVSIAVIFLNIITLKLADWSALRVKELSGLEGISITTISGVTYYPFAIWLDKFLDRFKYLKELDVDPEYLKNKLGIFGEPMIIGFFLGILLGIGAAYDIRGILELAFSIAAVIYILPLMAGVLGKGLMSVSDGMKDFIKRKYPDSKDLYIGLDLAVLLGNSSIIVTGILLMPVALILAFLIPGVNFIPLADLSTIIAAVSMVVVAVKGNILKSFIIFIPIMIGKLLVASRLAFMYSNLTLEANIEFPGYDGLITGFLDGGNLLRYWTFELFNFSLWAILLIPVIVFFIWYSRRESKLDQLAITDSSRNISN